MINTDDVIRKILTQAQSALNETNQQKKAAYLYSIQTLTELVTDNETINNGATNFSQPAPTVNSSVTKSDMEVLELKKMMGDSYQQKTPSSAKSDDNDQYEQGNGSLLDF